MIYDVYYDMIWYDWVLTYWCCTLVYLKPLYTS